MTTQITERTKARLEAELERLTTVELPAAQALIVESRSAGDISENPDFHVALGHEGDIKRRITQLKSILEGAELVSSLDSGSATVGSLVTIDWGDNEVEQVVIGHIAEQEGSDYQIVTPGSNLGEALIGAVAGDTVSYTTPTGASVSVTVVEVGDPA